MDTRELQRAAPSPVTAPAPGHSGVEPPWTARLAERMRDVLAPRLGQVRARELIGRSYAVCTMIYYSVRAQHARTALGLLWAVLTPLLFLAVYLPLFTYVFNARTPGAESDRLAFPIYVIVGFLAWTAFSEGLNNGATSLIYNPSVVRHSPAPPATLPLVKVASSFVGFVLSSLLTLAVIVALGRWPGWRLLVAPVAGALLFGFTWGLALLAAAVATHVRDALQVLSTILVVEFFACPLIYQVEMVPPHLRHWIQLNPFTPFLNLVRGAFIPAAPLEAADFILAAAWTALAIGAGRAVFRRLEPGFADAA